MAPTVVLGLAGLSSLVGSELGTSDWHEVTQSQVDAFADATGDHQWIHVDPERAAKSPFGSTIAHGYLTLALVPALLAEAVRVEGISMGVNYGANRIRFPSPVPVGSRLRLRARLDALDEVQGGAQGTLSITMEREGSEKPAMVAEILFRYFA
jgi:acyl dehydratase